MNKATNMLIFTAGAALGAVLAWTLSKRKYEQLAREEIDSVKEVYSKRAERFTTATEKPDIAEYAELVKTSGYSTESENSKTTKNPGKADRPYVISPDAFDESGYEVIELTYYADGVLADENDEPIDNVDKIVGTDSLKHLGEFEEDCIHVRNDILGVDYEILADKRKYSEVDDTR